MAKFSHTILYVNNVMKALDFYEKVFGLKPKMIYEEKTYAELDTGSTVLAFADNSLADFNIPTGYIKHDQNNLPLLTEIVLKVDDVEHYFELSLRAGAKQISPPTEKPWGETIGYIQDPNGVLVAICSSNDLS